MSNKHHKNDVKELFTKLQKDFHEIVNNKQLLRSSTEKFLNNLIDELTLGVIFDVHRKAKTRAFDLDGDSDGLEMERGVDIEIFAQYNIKKTQDCVCPYCDRSVAATRFATHLEKCMVEGKNRQKNAARKPNPTNITIKEHEPNVVSDDEDDADWSPGDKRSKKRKEKNGKKRRGTPTKKPVENEYLDNLNVDIEGDEFNNLRELLQEQHLTSSPATNKKKSKKKSRKDTSTNHRSSPCSSTSSLD